MRSFSWGRNPNGTGWLNEYFSRQALSQQVHRWWRWAFVSLGCAAGCSTPQHPGHVVGPFQATGEMLSQAGDSMTEVVTGRPRPMRMLSPTNGNMPLATKMPMSPSTMMPQNAMVGGASPAAPPATELTGTLPPGSYVIPSNNTGMTIPVGAVVTTPASRLATTPATSAEPTFAIPQLSIAPASVAPPATLPPIPPHFNLEPNGLKPAMNSAPLSPPAPLPVKAASSSRPINPLVASWSTPVVPSSGSLGNVPAAAVSQETATTSPVSAAASTNWCLVRVRNISNKPIKKFSASVLPPAEGQMVVKETKTNQNLNVSQCDLNSDHPVNPGEELSVTVGLIIATEKPQHLHVQIRDALGGNQLAIQSRWQVLIEPTAAP